MVFAHFILISLAVDQKHEFQQSSNRSESAGQSNLDLFGYWRAILLAPNDDTELLLAISHIGAFGDRALVLEEPIASRIFDKNKSIHYEAVLAIGAIGPRLPATLRQLQACTSDSDPLVRKAAVQALGGYRGFDQGIKRIIEKSLVWKLYDLDADVGVSAAGSLLRLGQGHRELAVARVFAIIEHEKIVRTDRVVALALGGSDVVDWLVQRMHSKEICVRASAIAACTRIGPKARKAIPTLLRLLITSSDAETRARVPSCLEVIGKENGLACWCLMYSLTVDRRAEVRYQAAAALGNMGYQISLIPLIIAYNFDDDLFVKAEANRAIVRMGAKRR